MSIDRHRVEHGQTFTRSQFTALDPVKKPQDQLCFVVIGESFGEVNDILQIHGHNPNPRSICLIPQIMDYHPARRAAA